MHIWIIKEKKRKKKTMICKYCFVKLTEYWQKTMFLILMLLTQMVFFWVIYVFLQLSWISLFELTEPMSTLKKLSCSKYSLQKLTQFSERNNVLDAPASNTDSCLWETHVFLKLRWIGIFGEKRPYFNFEIPKFQEAFISKLYLL
jgi:hypothetical protein